MLPCTDIAVFQLQIQIRRHNWTAWTTEGRCERPIFDLYVFRSRYFGFLWIFHEAHSKSSKPKVFSALKSFGIAGTASDRDSNSNTGMPWQLVVSLARTQKTMQSAESDVDGDVLHDFVSLVGITIILHRMRVVQFRRQRSDVVIVVC